MAEEAEQERRESARRKREVAVDFIRRIRGMGREELHDLILREAGGQITNVQITDYTTYYPISRISR